MFLAQMSDKYYPIRPVSRLIFNMLVNINVKLLKLYAQNITLLLCSNDFSSMVRTYLPLPYSIHLISKRRSKTMGKIYGSLAVQ